MPADWMNNDGLYIKYGTDAGKSLMPAGAYGGTEHGLHCAEFVIDLTLLTETETVMNDVVIFPANAYVSYVEVETLVVALTGTAIDVGLMGMDRVTPVDADGFLTIFPIAAMGAAGERTRLQQDTTVPTGIAGRGALVGTETTVPGLISASRTSATAFTAGKVRVRIFYTPKGLDVAT